MSILVLGGAGYIGSHTVYKLIEDGYDVVVADNLQTGHIEAVHPKARFYEGDIRDRKFLDELFDKEHAAGTTNSGEKIDGVIHFAANSLVAESMREPLKYYENNLYGTMVLLQAMVDHGVDTLVFSSTAAVYGEPEHIPIVETDRTQPTNVYGETKLAMEKMIDWTAKAHGLNYVALRYFNACGTLDLTGSGCESFMIGEAHAPETHLIPLVLQVPNGKRASISVFGDDYTTADGTCIRDYIHVMDLAQAHVQAMKYLFDEGTNDIFNLGNGKGFSVAEIIEHARHVTGHPIPAVIEPRRHGDPAMLVASNDKAQKVLGWQPEYTNIEDIIRTAWQWHENHPDGY
ncbi:MAG: UDP-glucose 4-epimerase GalE [Firmicutes bacterium]|nr:UDP-glucose 4-epimerase GalE [Bacillota bacterium]